MSGRRYKTVTDRDQIPLFPPSLEEYVDEENPVRAIDAYVESLDLDSFGFMNAGGEFQTRPPALSPRRHTNSLGSRSSASGKLDCVPCAVTLTAAIVFARLTASSSCFPIARK